MKARGLSRTGFVGGNSLHQPVIRNEPLMALRPFSSWRRSTALDPGCGAAPLRASQQSCSAWLACHRASDNSVASFRVACRGRQHTEDGQNAKKARNATRAKVVLAA